MENLGGSDIQVILSLKEGRGFDLIANPTTIVATLNGQSLETGCVECDPKPRYTTDLVWKMEKNVLRKMRSGHEALKVTCFEVKENGKRERIGFFILSVRSARVVLPRDGGVQVAASWHKFCNLRNDLRAHKPEISLALTIEEHDAYVRRISQKEPMEIHNPIHTSNENDPRPYLIEEESLIQLGPVSSCRSLFLLNVTAGVAQNLHLFKDEKQYARGDYSLWYRILENDVRLKSFTSLEKRWALDEKIVIRIRSSLTVLRNYLRQFPNFLVIAQHGNTILGYSEIDLRTLIPAETTEQSLANGQNIDTTLNRRCVLSSRVKTPRVIGDCADNEAFLDLQLRMVYVGSKNITEQSNVFHGGSLRGLEESMILPEPCFSDIDTHRNPCGDFSKCNNRGYRCEFETSKRVDRLPESYVIRDSDKSSNRVEAYHCYCLNIDLTGIRLSSTLRNLEFRFHHPKSDITSTVSTKIPTSSDQKVGLQDIGCKINFVSATDAIRHLLTSFPPRISISDVSGDADKPVGETILDVDRLFHIDTHQCQYEAPLYDIDDKKQIGTIDVAMRLEDLGPHNKTCRRNSSENLGPPIMDDSLVYKIVEELEAWKERQQEIFYVELNRKEERHLDRLSEEWQKRRENLEAKLACSVEQCKLLANSLNQATEDLRMRRLKSLEKEARLIKANEDMQWRYENKIQELQDTNQRVHDEFSSKIKALEERKNSIETEMQSLRAENERLLRITTKQAEEIAASKKGALTHDQTALLLQELKTMEEKLVSTQNSKSFFKEQWGKAVREIHRMKMEHQQTLETQIKTSKEELKNLDLEEMLCSDSLSNDQIMLERIQKEIDVIKPRPNYPHADLPSQRAFFHPQDMCYSPRKQSHRSVIRSSEHEERLRKLIEERSSLLKTGSYTIDDTVMVKLNAEIQSLLMTNQCQ